MMLIKIIRQYNVCNVTNWCNSIRENERGLTEIKLIIYYAPSFTAYLLSTIDRPFDPMASTGCSCLDNVHDSNLFSVVCYSRPDSSWLVCRNNNPHTEVCSSILGLWSLEVSYILTPIHFFTKMYKKCMCNL